MEYHPDQPHLQNQVDINKTFEKEQTINKAILKQDFNTLNQQNFGNPIACAFSFIFKMLSILIFGIGGLFLSSILIFIIVLIFSAFDFWMTKNILGRQMVGLRWWADTNQNEENNLKYQHYDSIHEFNQVNITFFWASLTVADIFWIILFIKNFLSVFLNPLALFWCLLIGINIGLLSMNLYAFYNCKIGTNQLNKEYSKKIDSLKKNIVNQIASKF